MVNWLMVSHLILRPIVIPPLTLTTCYPMINIIIIIIIIIILIIIIIITLPIATANNTPSRSHSSASSAGASRNISTNPSTSPRQLDSRGDTAIPNTTADNNSDTPREPPAPRNWRNVLAGNEDAVSMWLRNSRSHRR